MDLKVWVQLSWVPYFRPQKTPAKMCQTVLSSEGLARKRSASQLVCLLAEFSSLQFLVVVGLIATCLFTAVKEEVGKSEVA